MLAGGQAAQSEESGVGVRSLGEPVEQERQQLLHQAGGPGEPPRQLQDGLPGAVGVAEPEGGQPLDRSPGRRGRPGARPGSAGPLGSRRAVKASSRGRKKSRSWIGPHGRLVTAELAVEEATGPWLRRRRGSPSPSPGAPAQPATWGWHGSADPRRAGGGARWPAGTGTPRRARWHPRRRRSRPRPAPPSADNVFGERRSGSARPWTNWSSWTANSMSRMPPRPSLQLPLRQAAAGHVALRPGFHGPNGPQLLSAEGATPDPLAGGGHEGVADLRRRRPPAGP